VCVVGFGVEEYCNCCFSCWELFGGGKSTQAKNQIRLNCGEERTEEEEARQHHRTKDDGESLLQYRYQPF